MGIFSSRTPDPWAGNQNPPISYELICDALTKWYGEPAFFAHVIYLDDITTSYTSEMVQWKICVKRGEGYPGHYDYAALMLKHNPRIQKSGQIFRSADFFKNEIKFYENILPELLRFQDTKEVSGRFDNHVRLCFSFCDGKYDTICLGDARVEGFDVAKQTTMDINHGKLTLRTLARFHAISFALKTENPKTFDELINEISETYYSEKFWSWYKKLWGKLCAVAIDAVEKEYPDSIYVMKIKEFAVPKRYKDLIKAVTDKENCVLLHGDCRTSNYLFKYTDERSVDVKMVDFQQTRCASPALDVSCILNANRELLKDSDALLNYYHGNLITRIKELGGNPDVYIFDVFMGEMRKYSYFGLAFSFDAACTKITRDDISKNLFEWDKGKIRNIADAYEIKNLENEERRNLAYSVVYCVNNGYI